MVIVGANSDTMSWNGPTPPWTWTHYEISLEKDSFGVDQATFDGIMANVAEVRILAEFTISSETVGLDNVRLTATPVTVYSAKPGRTLRLRNRGSGRQQRGGMDAGG